jgi:hypothetical protein
LGYSDRDTLANAFGANAAQVPIGRCSSAD